MYQELLGELGVGWGGGMQPVRNGADPLPTLLYPPFYNPNICNHRFEAC